MTEVLHATINPEIHGIGEPFQWVAGTYDELPLQVRLASALLARLRDGDVIAAERLEALTALVTDRIHNGQARLGRELPEGRGIMLIALDMTAWEEAERDAG